MLPKLLPRNTAAPVFYFGDTKCAAMMLRYREEGRLLHLHALIHRTNYLVHLHAPGILLQDLTVPVWQTRSFPCPITGSPKGVATSHYVPLIGRQVCLGFKFAGTYLSRRGCFDSYLKQTGASMSTCGNRSMIPRSPSFTTGQIPLSAGDTFALTQCLLAGCAKDIQFLL